MLSIGIVGNGPEELLEDFRRFSEDIDIWIGADRGALFLARENIYMQYAVGDFDSVSSEERQRIKQYSKHFQHHPEEKNETDLELALIIAYQLKPENIYLFGVTGGRLDHGLANIQQLYTIRQKGIQGVIVDKQNRIEMFFPGTYEITKDKHYPYISFIPFSKKVEKLSLEGFYYPLKEATICWGSTRCISNELLENSGTFSFQEGIVLIIKSRNVI